MPKKVPVNEVLKLTRQGYTDADIIKYLRSEGYSSIEINDAINQAKIKMELARTAGMEEEFAPASEGYEVEGAAEEMPEYVPETEAVPEEEMIPSIMEEGAAPEEVYAPEAVAEAPAPAPAPTEEVPTEGYYPSYAPGVYEAAAAAAPTEAIEELAEEIINEKWEEFKAKIGDVAELRSYIESRLKQIEDRVKRLEIAFDKVQLTMMSQVQASGREVKMLGSQMQAMQGAFSQILQPLVSSVKELRELSEEMKTKATKPVAKKIEKAVKKLEETEKKAKKNK
ncbi:MAG: hypothetical protein QW625_02855 [Candidatus Nanoarchaeia archaeon]